MNIRNIILPATGSTANGSGGNADGLYRHAYIFIVLVLVLIFVGFVHDFPRLSTFPWFLHVHAGAAMLWMALVLTQTFLISRDNVRIHRKLGKLSFVLAPLLIMTAGGIIYVMLTFKPEKFPLKPGDPRLPLAYVDLGLILYFALFYVLAMVYRHDFRRHQRYLLASTFVVVPAALGRIILNGHFFAHSGHLSPGMSVVYSDVFIVAVLAGLLLFDWRKRKLYFAYWFSLLFFTFQIATTQLVASSNLWFEFCRWVAG